MIFLFNAKEDSFSFYCSTYLLLLNNIYRYLLLAKYWMVLGLNSAYIMQQDIF